MANLREQIAGLARRRIVPVDFGGIKCFLRRWNEREQVEWQVVQDTVTPEEPKGWRRCKAIVRSLCDEDGVLLYAADEYKTLAELDSSIINPVWDAVIELQGGESDDEAKKNSQEAPRSNSA